MNTDYRDDQVGPALSVLDVEDISAARAARLRRRCHAVLAQKATSNGKLLWFWTPEYFATNSFGPFVNRNHFAGWMLLPLGLTLGLVLGHISRSAPDLGATWRDRLLWLGTAAASPVLLASSALIAIACSLVWTMSRSGMLGAVVVVTMFTAAALWRVRGGVRVVVASGAVALVAGVVAWRGPETLVNWYGRTATFDWRLQLWADTLPVLRDFWLTGSGLNTYGQLMLIRPLTDTRLDPVQAHNDYLQLAVEGGLLVTLPALLLVGAVGHRIWRALRMPQDPMWQMLDSPMVDLMEQNQAQIDRMLAR